MGGAKGRMGISMYLRRGSGQTPFSTEGRDKWV